jgi:large subunit ribosomal protein L24
MKKLKKDDKVFVLSGKDKGKTGTILGVSSDGKALVSGLNLVKKHQKANPQLQVQGGIITKEMPIDLSNLAYFDVETSKPQKIGFKLEETEKGLIKKRFLKKTGRVI